MLDINFRNGTTPRLTRTGGYSVSTNSSTIAQGYKFFLDESVVVTKYVGIATTDAFEDPLAEAQRSSSSARLAGFASATTA